MCTDSGGAYTIITNALKACGIIIRLEPHDFLEILSRSPDPLVVGRSSVLNFKTRIRNKTAWAEPILRN